MYALTVLNVTAAVSEFFYTSIAGVVVMLITLPVIVALIFWVIPREQARLNQLREV